MFVEGLGSMYDKCEREAKIASYLGRELLIKRALFFENLKKFITSKSCNAFKSRFNV